MIWEPFVLALFLGVIVSAGLYFAYLWPSVEPQETEPAVTTSDPASASSTDIVASTEEHAPAPAVEPPEQPGSATTGPDGPAEDPETAAASPS